MNQLMRIVSLGVLAIGTYAIAAENPPASQVLTPVPFTEVRLTDSFWAPRINTNRTVTIRHAFKSCEETGRIDNFSKAAGLMKGEFRGIYFDDSDVYKAIEGAAYSLATQPDPELDKYLDGLIAKLAAAQQKDGYLNCYYTIKEPGKRWTNFKDMHELYCAGHLIEAAVAHNRATGKRNLLDVARKFADHIDATFGPGKKFAQPGHEEIELALVKLYHLTGEARYLNLAKYFIDVRGDASTHKLWGPYHQDHMPVTQQSEVVGHAVRAMYLFCGVTDVAAATGNKSYLPALDRLWDDVVNKKMYITGGIGSRHSGEAFGDPYELPNDTAYCETCAAIGNALWNQRMFLLYGDSKYADVVEQIIYNGFLSGVSLSGDSFFYVNPLASSGNHHRQAWYGCACCPVNVVRFLPSLPGYVYATRGNDLYVNLYAQNEAKLDVNGATIRVTQQTNYPWDGVVQIGIDAAAGKPLTVHLRLPAWCQSPAIALNGQVLKDMKVEKGYAVIDRPWSATDKLQIDFPMPVRRVKAHPQVKADIGRVALQRGPVVYCLEAVDNGGKVNNIILPADATLTAKNEPNLLGGVTVLTGKAQALTAGSAQPMATDITAIPYYAWDHRQPGQMAVWIAQDPAIAQKPPVPTIASTSKLSASHRYANDTLAALNDQILPASSKDATIPRLTWWDHRGTTEWVQYDFAAVQTVSSAQVYWFDDTGAGNCRTPQSWRLMYKEGQTWKPVENITEYGAKLDQLNPVTFTPVKTSALRLEAKLQDRFSAGIMEWSVK